MDDHARKLALDAQERLARNVRRLNPGALGGRSEQAQPPPSKYGPQQTVTQAEEKTFYLSGGVANWVGLTSGVYTPREKSRLTIIISELRIASIADIACRVMKNGAADDVFIIPAGATKHESVIGAQFIPTIDQLALRIDSAIDGFDLTQTVVIV